MAITKYRAKLPEASYLSPLSQQIVARGGLSHGNAADADVLATRHDVPVDDVLQIRYGLHPRLLLDAQSATLDAPLCDPTVDQGDPRLLAAYGAHRALQTGLLPWRRMGSAVIVLAAQPEHFANHQEELNALYGDVRLALTTKTQIHRAVTGLNNHTLAKRAENRVDAAFSSRDWNGSQTLKIIIGMVMLLGGAGLMAPVATLVTLTALTTLLLLASAILKCAAMLQGTQVIAPPHPATKHTVQLPVITMMVPLYREKAIARHLIARLEALDYPRELLDVCFVLEEDDDTTRAALSRTQLLTWMRAIVVPPGALMTKPRAMNYALDFARGDIVGIYDAEDAPDPQQLRVVAKHFAQAPPDVACLQGVLDYYNSDANWLTRCFTIEYASWFRVILPGFSRMGLVVPLGGTTLFFKRDVLNLLGAWDAHNVTEDADLGVRLARHGYRTEFIATVTEEEANGRFWPWIRQRGRWLKGYAITYCVHMRNPVQLWRELGSWQFFGFQVLFCGTLGQFLLAPLLWSFWLIAFGIPHPVADILPTWMFWTLAGLFTFSEVIMLVINVVALRRAGKMRLIPWCLTMQLYLPLATIAAYRALIELTWRPFYWDKTSHGVLMPQNVVIPQPPPQPRQASTE